MTPIGHTQVSSSHVLFNCITTYCQPACRSQNNAGAFSQLMDQLFSIFFFFKTGHGLKYNLVFFHACVDLKDLEILGHCS